MPGWLLLPGWPEHCGASVPEGVSLRCFPHDAGAMPVWSVPERDWPVFMQAMPAGFLLRAWSAAAGDLPCWPLLPCQYAVLYSVPVQERHVQQHDALDGCFGEHSLHAWYVLRQLWSDEADWLLQCWSLLQDWCRHAFAGSRSGSWLRWRGLCLAGQLCSCTWRHLPAWSLLPDGHSCADCLPCRHVHSIYFEREHHEL